jgi:hypothetical protein
VEQGEPAGRGFAQICALQTKKLKDVATARLSATAPGKQKKVRGNSNEELRDARSPSAQANTPSQHARACACGYVPQTIRIALHRILRSKQQL